MHNLNPFSTIETNYNEKDSYSIKYIIACTPFMKGGFLCSKIQINLKAHLFPGIAHYYYFFSNIYKLERALDPRDPNCFYL